MSLSARAGGGGGPGLAGRLSPSSPAGVACWLSGREAPGAAGPGLGGARSPAADPTGGCLAACSGPAGKGAAAGDRRREPEGDRARRAPYCPGELF